MNEVNEIKDLLKSGNLKLSIAKLEEILEGDLTEELNIISFRFQELQAQVRKGIISKEDEILHTNQISDSVLKLLNKENKTDSYTTVNKRNKIIWLSIGLLALVPILALLWNSINNEKINTNLSFAIIKLKQTSELWVEEDSIFIFQSSKNQVTLREFITIENDSTLLQYDPVLDITMINRGERPALITKVGIETIEGPYCAKVLESHQINTRVFVEEKYDFDMDRFEYFRCNIGEKMIPKKIYRNLENPILVGKDSPFRFEIKLANFGYVVYDFLLLKINLVSDEGIVVSNKIELRKE